MSDISRIDIYDQLEKVIIPDTGISIVKYKGIKGLDIKDDGTVFIKVDVPAQVKGKENDLKKDILDKLLEVNGVRDVKITLTVKDEEYGKAQFVNLLPSVKYPLIVGSGKGGVGKSTVTVNLAIALSKLGFKVGLLDGDLYGPSIPLMLGSDATPVVNDNQKMEPVIAHGIKVMSLGFLLDDETPVIWRGPLLIKALQQFLTDVDWGELDFLLTDLPPGTGDIQISLAQNVAVKGAIAVTTPQDVALLDVKKAITMFKTIKIPVLGIIENMSYFKCPDCNAKHHIFSGDKRDTSEKLGHELLGEIPITLSVREGGDKGLPVTISEPDSDVSKSFTAAAKRIVEIVSS